MKTQLLSLAFLFCIISVNAQFAPPVEIATSFGYSASAADINGDGFIDIIYNKPSLGMLVWRENINGEGNFGPD